MDGFYLTVLQHQSALPSVAFGSPKGEPGRFFVGLPWNCSRTLSGGSLTGFNLFMGACVALSAICVGAIILALTSNMSLALVAALLKLTNAAGGIQMFANACLSIYFSELALWVAVLALVLLLRQGKQARRAQKTLLWVVMILGLVLQAGVYESSWGLILLIPPLLFVLGALEWRAVEERIHVIIWYVTSAATILISLAASRTAIAQLMPDVALVNRRFWHGVVQLTWVLLYTPLREILVNIPTLGGQSGNIPRLALIAVVGLVVVGCLWWMRKITINRPSSRRPKPCTLLAIGTMSFMLLVSGMLPSCLKFSPDYGTRLVYYGSFGSLLLMGMTLVVWNRAKNGIVWMIGALFVSTFAMGSMLCLYRAGDGAESYGVQQRAFWSSFCEAVPGLENHTVVVIEDAEWVGWPDMVETWIVRELVENATVYVISSQSLISEDPVSQDWIVENVQDITSPVTEESMSPGAGVRVPPLLASPHRFQLPQDLFVWLRWDGGSLRLAPEKSNMKRIAVGSVSRFGRQLYPEQLGNVPRHNGL